MRIPSFAAILVIAGSLSISSVAGLPTNVSTASQDVAERSLGNTHYPEENDPNEFKNMGQPEAGVKLAEIVEDWQELSIERRIGSIWHYYHTFNQKHFLLPGVADHPFNKVVIKMKPGKAKIKGIKSQYGHRQKCKHKAGDGKAPDCHDID